MKARIAFLFLLSCFAAQGQGQDFEGFKNINGTQLYFKIIGKGEPIVIVHGGPGMNYTYFMPHLNDLAKKFRIVFYDQRASGRSATPSPDSISLKFFADDIEAIRKDLGVEKLNLFAHSWGAIPAVSYGIRYPDKVKRLILCAPVALSQEFDQETMKNFNTKALSKDSTDRSIILGSKEFKSGNPEAYKKLLMLSFRHSFYNPGNASKLSIDLPANYLKAGDAFMAGMGKELSNYNFYDDVKAFEFPVLVMHGATDAIPLAASTRTRQSMPKATLQVFAKSGHFIFIDEPRKFRTSITSFMEMK